MFGYPFCGCCDSLCCNCVCESYEDSVWEPWMPVLARELMSAFVPLLFWGIVFFGIDAIHFFDVNSKTVVPGFVSRFTAATVKAQDKILDVSVLSGFSVLLVILNMKRFAIVVCEDVARIMYWIGSCYICFAVLFPCLVEEKHPGSFGEFLGLGFGLAAEGIVIVMFANYLVSTRKRWRIRKRIKHIIIALWSRLTK